MLSQIQLKPGGFGPGEYKTQAPSRSASRKHDFAPLEPPGEPQSFREGKASFTVIPSLISNEIWKYHVAGHCKEIDNGPRWCTCDGTMETLTLGAGSPHIAMQQSRSPTTLACLAIVGIHFCAKPFVGRRGQMCRKNNFDKC